MRVELHAPGDGELSAPAISLVFFSPLTLTKNIIWCWTQRSSTSFELTAYSMTFPSYNLVNILPSELIAAHISRVSSRQWTLQA